MPRESVLPALEPIHKPEKLLGFAQRNYFPELEAIYQPSQCSLEMSAMVPGPRSSQFQDSLSLPLPARISDRPHHCTFSTPTAQRKHWPPPSVNRPPRPPLLAHSPQCPPSLEHKPLTDMAESNRITDLTSKPKAATHSDDAIIKHATQALQPLLKQATIGAVTGWYE
jgi:hypothetical protein